MEEGKELLENIKQFKKSAEIIYKTSDFTSSTILYFKCLFSILDLIILKKAGAIPKDHTERFRIIEKLNFSLYTILDKLYSTYRNAYTARIDKNKCDKVKENVERIIEEQRIFENN